jgi:H+-translocating NAD(P) transhydrogenase subunit beta
MSDDIRNLIYLLAAVLFIFGLKGLSHPRKAVRGNMLGALGMLLAAGVTVLGQHFSQTGWGLIIAGVVAGTVAGVLLATRIQMTAMPQMVALLNGFGGAASFLVAGAVLHETHYTARTASAGFSDIVILQGQDPIQSALATVAAGLIGALTLTGSIVAFGKLQDIRWFDQLTFSFQRIVTAALTLLLLALAVIALMQPGTVWLYWLIVLVAMALGVLLVTPIGGADMLVVILLLNSYSGLAAAATGFVINNTVLIIAGSLVGAAGLILTKIMCVAMNRSLTNVLFGGMGMAVTQDKSKTDAIYANVKSAAPEEIAMLLEDARRVMIVPGYGMAVSQAQHAVRDLANLLESRSATVEYAIHPVAGRMPGHMNVLLAEADVPYDKLKEMDEANSEIEQVDVAIVIGANDTVNPIARSDPSSPIAGMPIINVDKARTVVVIKRSLSPGFAGIPNPLFAAENTLMYFADCRDEELAFSLWERVGLRTRTGSSTPSPPAPLRRERGEAGLESPLGNARFLRRHRDRRRPRRHRSGVGGCVCA